MTAAESWRNLFESWPAAFPKKAMLATTFGETISIVDFMISGGILLVERDKPDSQGARKVMISYDAISAVKLETPMELTRFQVFGFQPPC